MIKNLLGDDEDRSSQSPDVPAEKPNTIRPVLSLFDSDPRSFDEDAEKDEFVLSSAEPESYAETARRSGLAWSAGIAFFAAVVFMLILGWGADLLFGSSPWGIVVGIVVGSLIGFIQFFRLTSQIFRK